MVAVRLNDSIEEEILSQSPNVIFRNINNSASYSVNVAAGVPYIAAEGLASLIPAEFILGDDNVTRTFNDIPLYTNGPLLEGTRYSVFVRAFVRTVGGGVSLNKRQTAPRQYSSFSSSDFLTPVSTFVPGSWRRRLFDGFLIHTHTHTFAGENNYRLNMYNVIMHIYTCSQYVCSGSPDIPCQKQ